MLRSRREQPAEEVEVPSLAGLSQEVEGRVELRELLVDLAALPERQREALVLSELGDLSHADVADVLGCETKQVKSLVFGARTSLIESRRARDIPCAEIREQLAVAHGGALRRGPLRRDLEHCEGCREFRDEVQRQRALLGAVLPVVPTIGLKETALAAAGIGLGGGGAAGGGGVIAALGAHSAAKATAVVIATGGTVGGVAATDPELFSGKARGADVREADAAEGGQSAATAEAQGVLGRTETSNGEAGTDGQRRGGSAGRAEDPDRAVGRPGNRRSGRQKDDGPRAATANDADARPRARAAGRGRPAAARPTTRQRPARGGAAAQREAPRRTGAAPSAQGDGGRAAASSEPTPGPTDRERESSGKPSTAAPADGGRRSHGGTEAASDERT